MAMFNTNALETYIRRGEKEDPPVFVGRGHILDDILAISKESWKPDAGSAAGDHGVQGNTRIVHGAPGAGKSSILRKIKGWEIALPTASGSGLPKVMPEVLLLNSANIVSPAGILEPLAEIVCKKRAPGFIEQYERSLSLGVNLGGVGINVQRQSTSNRDQSFTGIEEFGRWLKSLPERSRLKSPVIIAIDEAQRLDEDASSPIAKVLQALHDNTWNMPFTLVLAGLGDTPDKSRKMQLTRGSRLHEVGCLSSRETQEVIEGFCSAFGVNPAGCENRLSNYAKPSEGWPRHLYFAQTVLGKQVLRTQGDMQALDWNLLDDEFKKSRIAYYRAQQSPEMELADSLTAVVMTQFREGMKLSDIVKLVKRNQQDEIGFSLPKPYSDEVDPVLSYISHLVHQGAIQKSTDDAYYTPIPSFRSFLIEQGNLGPSL
ncbi:MAG: AAA family ATPase [Gammaproteobacteria bacterium]|nr:AAA family ATPase [Gammaproteobacteria bacterium]